MKIRMFTAVLLLNLFLSGTALAACTQPEIPAIPVGESANGSEMLKAKKAVEAYMAAVEEYLGCSRLTDRKHNQMVDKMQQVGGEFNDSVKAYKAKA